MNSLYIYIVILIIYPTFEKVDTYRVYRGVIPNGKKVPDPCYPGDKWKGVGHQLEYGGIDLNAFGLHFGMVHEWSRDLCRTDSDGDGLTNGEELGDPDCTWENGQPNPVPANGSRLSHPGICEPVHSERCKSINTWLTVENCPAINGHDENITTSTPFETLTTTETLTTQEPVTSLTMPPTATEDVVTSTQEQPGNCPLQRPVEVNLNLTSVNKFVPGTELGLGEFLPTRIYIEVRFVFSITITYIKRDLTTHVDIQAVSEYDVWVSITSQYNGNVIKVLLTMEWDPSVPMEHRNLHITGCFENAENENGDLYSLTAYEET